METYAQVITIAIAFFVGLIAVEFIVSIILKKKVYRSMDTISSLSSGLTNNMKSILKLSVVIISYTYMVEHLAMFEIKSTLWLYIVAFIGIDFAAYWGHRWNHEFNVLWNRHIIHHSSEEYNLACALRQSISDLFQVYFFLYIPMAIIGIPATVIAVLAPLHLFAQFWYHTRLINRMGFLEHIIMTPSHHRVHHAINPIYIDKNYSAIFIFWDKWFGTFQEELPDVAPVYGVKKAVQTWNPVLINFMHNWQLLKDAWHANSYWDKIRIWFMPTGWRPADVREKFPISFIDDPSKQIKYSTEASNSLQSWAWFQLVLHLAFQFHLISLLPDLGYVDLLYYAIFIVLSIFAYTSLMDRHWLAVPFEGLKMLVGFGLIYHMNGWYLLDNAFSFATTLMIGYLLLSFVLTVYFTYFDKLALEVDRDTVIQ